jgi:O-antigen ligase
VNVFASERVVSRRSDALSRGGRWLAVAVLVLILGLGIAVTFARASHPSTTLVFAGGTACLIVLALALARYEVAAGLGMLIFGVVYIQPAPPDAVLMIVMVAALVTGRFTLRRVPFPILGLLGIFIVLNLVSAIFAVSPGRAAFYFFITVYLCFFSVWITAFVDSMRRARVIVVPLVIGAVVTTALGVAVLYLNFPGKSAVDFSDGLRARGFFKDPNVFGPFCVFVALIVVSELLDPRLLKARRPLKFVMLLVLALGILFAASRAAWLNAAVAAVTMIVAYSLRRGGGRKAAAILVTLIVLAAAGSMALAASGSEGFLSSRAHFQNYDTQRFNAQEEGFRIVQDYPFGIGPGQFELDVKYASHSTYVRVLAEQGFLGLFVTLGVLLSTLGMATRNVILGRDTYGIGSVPLLAAFVGLLANSAFVDTIHWRHLWLVAGLIWAGAMRSSDEVHPH